MFSYRIMLMNMKSMMGGANSIASAQVLERYMVTPLKMNMTMHMLGFMYAPSDRITLSLMTNYQVNTMDLLTRMGATFTTESTSLGDTRISALYRLVNKNGYAGHLNIGFSLPTGNIDNKGVTPASAPDETILPYPMQNGSGSFEFIPGYTFTKKSERISLGGQFMGTFRLNENSRSYQYGNEFKTDLWGALVISNWLSTSLKAQYQYEDKLKGQDPAFENLMMVPTVDSDNFGGQYLNGGLGINLLVPSGSLKGLRFAGEYILPLYQKPNGMQMERKHSIIFGAQYAI